MAYRTKVVVPESTVPGTRPWAETVAANARRYAAFTEKDVRPLVERFRQLCDREAWELWYPGQMEARERFFREVLGYEAEFLDTMSKGVEILDGRGHEGPVSQQEAEHAALAPHGGDRRSVNAVNQDVGHNLKRREADYIVARLKRDAKDDQTAAELAEKVLRGEISPNAAARQKGWRPPRIYVTRPEAVAKALLKHMSADDIAKLIAVLVGAADLSAYRGDGTT